MPEVEHGAGKQTDLPNSIDSLVERVRRLFAPQVGLPTRSLATREAVLIVARGLELPESTVRAFGEREVSGDAARIVLDLARRRAAGEPHAYLFGEREFYGRRFQVSPAVLIPRPETEHLVETVTNLPLPDRARVLDVGTGSGCIAATLKAERPSWQIVAVDCSLAALAIARKNCRTLLNPLLNQASKHNRSGPQVNLLAGDLTNALRLAAFDLVVSNPPYVARDDAHLLSAEVVDQEPHLALFADEQGLAVYRNLFEQCGIAQVQLVVVEIGAGQRADVERIAQQHHFEPTRRVEDLAGHERCIVFTRGTANE